ncbi:MAG TPA: transposase [Gemmatimonadales bacterium]|nr:transposase [Gemmatimonadales bacterium]
MNHIHTVGGSPLSQTVAPPRPGLSDHVHRQSGSSLDAPSRIPRIGNATLRAALYFPALAAIRWNPLVAALRQRLKDQGRLKPKQIVGAAMRKLLHLCFGVLKTGKPFDPEHTTSTEETAAAT